MKRKSILITICHIMVLLCCFGVTVSVSAATNTTKTTITTLQEKAEGKIYLTWSKKNVDGYQVRWALNSKMTGVKSASFTTTEMYRSGLIGGKTYYFQVRTYKKINGKKVYSNWSAMRSIRLKKLPPTTSITSLTANSSSKFTVKWNKKANVKGYQIRYSTDSSFETKKTASTNGTSITRSGLSKGTYYVSVRTYNIASDGTKYYSNWSGMKSVTLQDPVNWKAIYKEFLSRKYQYYLEDWGELTVKKFGLYDINKDGIPELVVNQQIGWATYGTGQLYTIKDKKVILLNACGYITVFSNGYFQRFVKGDMGYPDCYTLFKLKSDSSIQKVLYAEDHFRTKPNAKDYSNYMNKRDAIIGSGETVEVIQYDNNATNRKRFFE